jgi:hypothetical protein
MTTKRKQESFIRGTAAHRRTESDYMGVLLDAVTLGRLAGRGSRRTASGEGRRPAARAWLAQYLVGKPETKAPSALTVVVQQWSGGDPLAEKLAKPIVDRAKYPVRQHENDDLKESVKAAIVAELAQKLLAAEHGRTPATARDSGDSGA